MYSKTVCVTPLEIQVLLELSTGKVDAERLPIETLPVKEVVPMVGVCRDVTDVAPSVAVPAVKVPTEVVPALTDPRLVDPTFAVRFPLTVKFPHSVAPNAIWESKINEKIKAFILSFLRKRVDDFVPNGADVSRAN